MTVFRPARTPGPQLIPMESYSALELFQLYLSSSVCQTLIRNSNAYAAKNQDAVRKPWQDMSVKGSILLPVGSNLHGSGKSSCSDGLLEWVQTL